MKTTVTVTDIMSAKPCRKYSQEVVKALWNGKEILTPREISSLDIPIQDRLWALIHAVLDSKNQRFFACDCAERALNSEVEKGSKIDSRSLKAIEVSRKYAKGLATDSELSAARDAASSAASSVSFSSYTALSDASYAAWVAAKAFAWSAAWYAVRASNDTSWQIEHILEMVEKVV